MIEFIIIGILFAGAVLYLGRLLKKSFDLKNNSCGKGCGCDALKEKHNITQRPKLS